MKTRLFFVEGINVLRHRVADYYWAASSAEARRLWVEQFGGHITSWRVER